MKAKIAINGYGTIGKRVADAITRQDDMEVVGVTKTRANWEAKLAIGNDFDLYCAVPDRLNTFKEAGIECQGTIDDLLKKVDLVVDCAPGKVGASNKEKYAAAKVKAIFQGGEKAETADVSFNPLCNYDAALGKDYIRVVSCNSTGLTTTLGLLQENISKVRAVMIRRTADPSDIKNGPVNAIVPNPISVPSHHGPDVQTVLPDLNIVTTAVKVPSTLMHLHSIMAELKKPMTEDDVIELFVKEPRIRLVRADEGLTSTAEVMELARDLARGYGDMYEIVVWEDSIKVKDNELYYFQAIHQESDVIPSNIDAIRAALSLEKDGSKSVAKTNESLWIN